MTRLAERVKPDKNEGGVLKQRKQIYEGGLRTKAHPQKLGNLLGSSGLLRPRRQIITHGAGSRHTLSVRGGGNRV